MATAPTNSLSSPAVRITASAPGCPTAGLPPTTCPETPLPPKSCSVTLRSAVTGANPPRPAGDTRRMY